MSKVIVLVWIVTFGALLLERASYPGVHPPSKTSLHAKSMGTARGPTHMIADNHVTMNYEIVEAPTMLTYMVSSHLHQIPSA